LVKASEAKLLHIPTPPPRGHGHVNLQLGVKPNRRNVRCQTTTSSSPIESITPSALITMGSTSPPPQAPSQPPTPPSTALPEQPATKKWTWTPRPAQKTSFIHSIIPPAAWRRPKDEPYYYMSLAFLAMFPILVVMPPRRMDFMQLFRLGCISWSLDVQMKQRDRITPPRGMLYWMNEGAAKILPGDREARRRALGVRDPSKSISEEINDDLKEAWDQLRGTKK